MVHRDLTPSNIMINVDGVVKLADFGLARQKVGTHSVMESVVGTVLYQCPEIIQAESYGEKADIWSLGCILYQMAMLRCPFEGGNPLVVAQKIVTGEYQPLTGSFTPLLSEAVRRMLTVNAADRPDIDQVGVCDHLVGTSWPHFRRTSRLFRPVAAVSAHLAHPDDRARPRHQGGAHTASRSCDRKRVETAARARSDAEQGGSASPLCTTAARFVVSGARPKHATRQCFARRAFAAA